MSVAKGGMCLSGRGFAEMTGGQPGLVLLVVVLLLQQASYKRVSVMHFLITTCLEYSAWIT